MELEKRGRSQVIGLGNGSRREGEDGRGMMGHGREMERRWGEEWERRKRIEGKGN